MVNKDIKKKLPDGAIVLDDQSYDNSIIGITLDDRVIYSYDLMIEEFMEQQKCTFEEEIEWIEFNTIRALPYMSNKRPMIVLSYEKVEE